MALTTAPVAVPSPSLDKLAAVDRIEEMAFWQLMLVDDLDVAELLVDLLVDKMRARLREIRLDAAGAELGS